MADGGTYRLTAENPSGSVTVDVKLTMEKEKRERKEKKDHAAPSFHAVPTNVKSRVGGSAKLKCSFKVR